MDEKEKHGVIDFIVFVTKYWYFFTIIFSLCLALMYHIVQLNNANEKIENLILLNSGFKEEIKTLSKKIGTLDEKLSDYILDNNSTKNSISVIETRLFGRPLEKTQVITKGSVTSDN